MQYTVTWSEQRKTMVSEQVKSKNSFYGEKTRTETMSSADSDIEYDLIGDIANACKLTRKSIVAILSKIDKDKFDMFNANPEEFISKVVKIIEEQKATTLVEHISYNITDGKYDSDIFTMQKTELEYQNAQTATKHIFDRVFTDSSKEKDLAKAMDAADEVVVYAKLPRTFKIPTPVGDYSPDWAIAFKDDCGIKHIYFIAETKGDLSTLNLRPIEKAKIDCAKKLFNGLSSSNVRYDAITNYDELISAVNG